MWFESYPGSQFFSPRNFFLLSCKPEFLKRARILIGHFIKFDELAQEIIEGLGKVGLNID